MPRISIHDVLWLVPFAVGCGEVDHEIRIMRQGAQDVQQHAREIDKAAQMTNPDVARKEQVEN